MFARLRSWLAPPVLGDEEQTRQAQLLYAVLVFTFGLTLVATTVFIFFYSGLTTSTVTGLVLATALLGLLVHLHQGRLRLTGWLLVATLLAALTVIAAGAYGLRAPSLPGYLLVIMIAGLVLGPRAALIAGGLSALATFSLFFLEHAGWLRPIPLAPRPSLAEWIVFGLVLIAATLMMRSAAHSLAGSLRQARERARHLDAAKLALEQRVQARTLELQALNTQLQKELVERRRVEADLRRSQDLLHGFVNALDDPVFVKDAQHRWVILNDSFCAQLGQPREALIGRSDYDFLPAAQADIFWAVDQEVLDTGATRINEELITWQAGTRLLSTKKSLFVDPVSGEKFVVGTIRDITDRRRMEEDLRRSEAHLRSIVTNLPVILFALDRDGVFTLSEGRGLSALGLRPGEVVGRSVFDVYADAPDVLALVRRALAGEAFLGLTQVGALWFETWYSPLRDAAGAVAGVIGVASDITERKRAEAALQASETRYRTTLAHIDEVVYMIRQSADNPYQGEIEFVSDRVETILGYPARAFADDQGLWFTLVHPDDVPHLQAQTAELFETKRPVTREYRMRRRNETEYRLIEDRVVPQVDEAGRIVATFGVARDITARKQAEAEREALIHELEARNAELERFTYTVSHDLKSPLITITGYLGYLERDALAGNFDRFRADLARIGNAAERMQTLLDELLELSRIGRLINPPEAVPLTELVREALEITAGRLERRGVLVQVAPDLPVVFGDRQRLREVVTNLLENAAKFMGSQPEPRVEIGVRRDGPLPVIFVRDNGLGIDPLYHDKVFGLFEKLDAHSEGTGIGLALVRRIVEVHGGRIWVESAGLGRGAAFCFTLPEAPPGAG